MHDIFYINDVKDQSYNILKDKFFTAKFAVSVNEAQKKAVTKFFYTVYPDIVLDSSFNFDYIPDDYSQDVPHVFLNGEFYDGIALIPKSYNISNNEKKYRFFVNKKEIDIVASTPKPYEVVFISYNESNADENYEILLKKAPYAKRVHGVKGIHQAHIEAAKLCNTDLFWVIDGDARIIDSFNFDYQVERWNGNTVHVWKSINPINGLVYGYGGVKLLPKDLTLNMNINSADMTTSISKNLKVVDKISNVTAFDTDPFNVWKSAFRECAKLSSKIIKRQDNNETENNLKIWTSVGEYKEFGEYAIKGAEAGKKFGLDSSSDLSLINNFDWLLESFQQVEI